MRTGLIENNHGLRFRSDMGGDLFALPARRLAAIARHGDPGSPCFIRRKVAGDAPWEAPLIARNEKGVCRASVSAG
jgi:hypothetical protein